MEFLVLTIIFKLESLFVLYVITNTLYSSYFNNYIRLVSFFKMATILAVSYFVRTKKKLSCVRFEISV